ncbi:MAG: hypothetical protein CME62_07005 [Halobacteriovoraceae bacterium]|nr:hypothetical protein [Halobacteriovoraceae bacterium]
MSLSLFIKYIHLFALGLLGCYLLRYYGDLNPVLASVLCGLLFSFLPFQSFIKSTKGQGAIYAGTFAAMSSSRVLNSINDFVLVCILGGLILTLFEGRFEGLGGRKGMIAFLAVAAFYMYRSVL